jgi:hypothetical protein
MLPATAHHQERAVDVACLHPPPRRELLMLSASCHHPGEELMLPSSTHYQERAVDVVWSPHTTQEKVVDVVCLLPQPRRDLLMLSASFHNPGESC